MNAPSSNALFYMVLCEHGPAAPPTRHATHALAETHAEQLCADTGSRAFVLKAVAVVEHHATSVVWTPLLASLATVPDDAPPAGDAPRARVVLDEDQNGDGSLHDDLERALGHVRVIAPGGVD